MTMDKMNEFMSTIMKRIETMRESRENEGEIPQNHPVANAVEEGIDPRFKAWTWGGKIHMVPETFELPKESSVKDVWCLWWNGHLLDKIQPYRRLRPADLRKKGDGSLLSRLKKVMNHIEEQMKLKNGGKRIETMTPLENAQLFDQVFSSVLIHFFPKPEVAEAKSSIKCITLYDYINPKKRRREN